MKDVLGAWAHAKTRPDIVNRQARRVFAQIARQGEIGKLDALAKTCGISVEQVRESLSVLTAARLLLIPVTIEREVF